MQRLAVGVTILLVMTAGAAVAQSSVFYPTRGQSPAMQSQDLAACRTYATQQAGVVPEASASQPPVRVGGRARGAAAGASVPLPRPGSITPDPIKSLRRSHVNFRADLCRPGRA